MLTQASVAAVPFIDVAGQRGEIIPEGQRNDTLFRHATSMSRQGKTVASIEAALLAENARCAPPLDESEIRRIAGSAGRYQQAPRLTRRDLQTSLRRWPTPLAEDAFHGLAGEFVEIVRPETEAHDAALLFSFLVTVGSIIGRGPHYQVGGDRHYANLFAVIVGESAKARKGTSWGELRRFAELIDEPWCKQRVAGGLSSGEGLIYAVRDPIIETVAQREGKRVVSYGLQTTDPGVEDKRLLAVENGLARMERHLTGGRASEVWKAIEADNSKEHEINEKSCSSVPFSSCADSCQVSTREAAARNAADSDVLKEYAN